MNSKDSYPDVDTGSNNAVDLNIMEKIVSEESSAEETSSSSEKDDYRGFKKSTESKNDATDGRADEVLESQIVLDDDSGDYRHESTGIKIRYTLKPGEVENFIEQSEGYVKNRKEQKKHTAMQIVIFVIMLVLGFLSTNRYYLILSLFPIISLLFIWIAPYFGVKKLVRDILKHREYSVEIFPDKIDIVSGDINREIPLDGSCESSEFENMIFIFSEQGLDLIIPLRAMEEDLWAEVQAMIVAGTNPKHKK